MWKPQSRGWTCRISSEVTYYHPSLAIHCIMKASEKGTKGMSSSFSPIVAAVEGHASANVENFSGRSPSWGNIRTSLLQLQSLYYYPQINSAGWSGGESLNDRTCDGHKLAGVDRQRAWGFVGSKRLFFFSQSAILDFLFRLRLHRRYLLYLLRHFSDRVTRRYCIWVTSVPSFFSLFSYIYI